MKSRRSRDWAWPSRARNSPLPRADPNAPGFADWVQLKIFVHIYTHYPNVKKEWDKATLQNTWFRDGVLGTRGGLDALSANPNNSPRIERFWPALHTASKRDQPDLESDAMSVLVTALIQLDRNDRAALERNVYYQRLEIPQWLRATVDVLRGPHADVTPILAAETAARTEVRRRAEEKERRAEHANPSSAHDVETANITTWDDMEAVLRAVRTRNGTPCLEDPNITEELTELRGFYPRPSPKDLWYFVSKIFPIVDLWPALDARRPQ